MNDMPWGEFVCIAALLWTYIVQSSVRRQRRLIVLARQITLTRRKRIARPQVHSFWGVATRNDDRRVQRGL